MKRLSRNVPLRPVAKNKIGRPKKPKPQRKPSLDDIKAKFGVTSASLLQRKPMKQRSDKNEGWVDVAKAIWNDPSNEHLCEVCGVFLGDDFSPSFYHHLIHRGSSRKLKRRPDNLGQICLGDHDKAHDYGIENLAETATEHRDGWVVLAGRLVVLRNEINNIGNGNKRVE